MELRKGNYPETKAKRKVQDLQLLQRFSHRPWEMALSTHDCDMGLTLKYSTGKNLDKSFLKMEVMEM